ncbi:class I SAM-dependent methyltransferase [Candidatus Woesebacteria bacterium]|nr:class I SAM-dependent methyltransferase [Candidatus Woesebacteria bacterium]
MTKKGKTTSSEEIREAYQEKFDKYGYDPRSLFWKGLGASHQRFRQMWAEIDFNDKSVLDVGCGFGEMARFLTKRYSEVKYTGVDIVPEFINVAREKYPDLRFEVGDYFYDPMNEKFDIVIASGTLNSNVENNMDFRKNAIKVMFEHTKRVLAFNMLGKHPQPENKDDSNIWYADSLEILDYCMSLTRRVAFHANYHPRDFTIFMYPVNKRN